jgi:hypothetical protein
VGKEPSAARPWRLSRTNSSAPRVRSSLSTWLLSDGRETVARGGAAEPELFREGYETVEHTISDR